MNHHAPKTLTYYQSNPQFRLVNVAHHAVAVMSAPAQAYKTGCDEGKIKHGQPDRDALWFYGLNHCAAIVRKKFTPNEVLPDWADKVMGAYTEVATTQVQRMTTYMILIVTREARHSHSYDTFYQMFKDKYGKAAADFYQKIHGVGEMSAIQKLLDEPPTGVSIEGYLEMLSHGFHKGTWSGGYGGKPWGVITDTLLQAMQGKISFEMMVDTGYTLAHNGGPMFNKSMMYEMYTDKFLQILDVQRSGQICELMMDEEGYGIPKISELVEVCKQMKARFPDEFGSCMDWYKVKPVEGKHAVFGYVAMMKKKQAIAHPESVPPQEVPVPVGGGAHMTKKKEATSFGFKPKEIDENTFVIYGTEVAQMAHRITNKAKVTA